MRVLIALVLGLVLGLAGGYLITNDMTRAGAAGLPLFAFRSAPCAAQVQHPIAFTAPEAQDTMTIQSSGPNCENVVAIVTIREAGGHIVFAYAARIDALMDPKINPVAVNGVDAVLDDYAGMADNGARAALPEWPDDSPDVANIAPYGSFTPLAGNALYRKVRDSNAPLLRLRDGRDSGRYFAYLPEIDESEEIARYSR